MPFKLVIPVARSSAMTGARSAAVRFARFIGDARGAVARVATGWHGASMSGLH
jgi:hypothetical protein